MPKLSAGLLVYRRRGAELEFFLVHPGGPFWRNREVGAWTIPKGEVEPGEDPLVAARREFTEETGFTLEGPTVDLGVVRQAGGKTVQAFALEGDLDADAMVSLTFQLEWPPRSGRQVAFPEVDRAGWFSRAMAAEKINPAQLAFLDRARVAAGVRRREDE